MTAVAQAELEDAQLNSHFSDIQFTSGDEKIKKVSDDVIYIPEVQEILYPLIVAIPLQLFAYHVADLRDCDVDKPRNLAKSVTVE